MTSSVVLNFFVNEAVIYASYGACKQRKWLASTAELCIWVTYMVATPKVTPDQTTKHFHSLELSNYCTYA